MTEGEGAPPLELMKPAGPHGVIDIAIICNSLPPYRLHLHQRIAREMPAVRLWTIRDHEDDARWHLMPPQEIRLVHISEGVACADQGIGRQVRRHWRTGGRIIRWLADNQVRAVILAGYNDVGRLRILRWCHRQGICCFISGDSNIRGDLASGFKALTKRFFLRWVLCRSTGALPFGQLGVEFFAKYGMDRGRMFLFPLEPDYALIQAVSAEQVEQAQRRFGLAPGRRRAIFCGRLVAAKRPDLLLKAFLALTALRPDWDLLMVGDGPMRGELEASVPPALKHRVIWTGFVDDQSLIGALYRSADLLVLPSDYEPWALVVNEAVAAGLAVVCTDVVGAAAELVRENANGYVFSPGDLQALCTRLEPATEPNRIEALKAASANVLSEWRTRADPIDGLRKALSHARLLGSV